MDTGVLAPRPTGFPHESRRSPRSSSRASRSVGRPDGPERQLARVRGRWVCSPAAASAAGHPPKCLAAVPVHGRSGLASCHSRHFGGRPCSAAQSLSTCMTSASVHGLLRGATAGCQGLSPARRRAVFQEPKCRNTVREFGRLASATYQSPWVGVRSLVSVQAWSAPMISESSQAEKRRRGRCTRQATRVQSARSKCTAT